MDIMRWGYETTFRANDNQTFKARWVECQPGAQPPPFSHAFGSSRQLWEPEYGPLLSIGEIYERNVVSSNFAQSPFAGTHVCGDVGFWKNGWPEGTPPLPLNDAGQPVCCGETTVSVQSVGLSLPKQFTVTGSPVFSTGILAGVWKPVPAHWFLGGPISGGEDLPDFRPVGAGDLGAGHLPAGVLLAVGQLTGPGTIDPSLLPGGATGPEWLGPFPITTTAMNTNANDIDLYTLADGEVFEGAAIETTTAWVDSGASSSPITVDLFLNGVFSINLVSSTGAIDGPLAAFVGATTNQPSVPNQWSIHVRSSPTFPPWTLGFSKVWLRVSKLP